MENLVKILNHFEVGTIDELIDIALVPVCILLVAVCVGMKINGVIKNYIERRFATAEDTTVKLVIINALRGLPRTWCIATGIYWTINSLNITPAVTNLLSKLLFILIVFTITQVVARAISGIIDLFAARNTNIPQTSLLNNIASAIIYAMGMLIILEYCGISIAPIITALGVGGMAVALGLQDTLANIFAGIHLMIAKQIRIGDYIKLNSGEEGRVSDITWRYTTVMHVLGNAIVIPNQKILSAIWTNYSNPEENMVIKVPIGVSYDSDLEHVERVTLEVAQAVTNKVEPEVTEPPKILFHTFNDSSIDFNVLLNVSEISKRAVLTHEFIKAIKTRYDAEGIDIPFPIRTVYNKDKQ